MEYEDTSNQEQEQKKPVIRRDKVVVTKVTEQELSQIKSTAEAPMTFASYIIYSSTVKSFLSSGIFTSFFISIRN